MTRRLVLLVYRLWLRATLPERFVDSHGHEIEELFDDAMNAAQRRGALAAVFAVVRGFMDVSEQAVRMRRSPAHGNGRYEPSGREMIVESILQDVRFAARSLARSPGFVTVAVLTLGVGIGANTAIFNLVNAVLLRAPAHVEEPDELVSIHTSDYSGGPPYGMSSRPDYEDFRAHSSAIQDAVALMPGVVNVSNEEGISEILITEFVTGNYFDVLGVRPILGRGFTAEEGDYTSGLAVAVLSHGMWSRRFGADPGVIGTTFRASGQTVTIVGVAPEGFTGSLPLISAELWMPDATGALILGARAYEGRGSRGSMIRARLADGASIELVQEQLTALSLRLQEEYPAAWTDVNDEVRRVGVADDAAVPPNFKGAVTGFAILLLAVVGIVLLIACANVANLTLARASRRGREMAIRVSMGAGRTRVVRQLLSESLLIGIAGGTLGALLTVYLMRLAESFRPVTGVAVSLDLGVDKTVFAFSALITLLTVVVVGLVPALRASRPDLVPQLKEGSGEGSGPFRWYELRHLLVISQVSASLILLVGAGLFLKSLRAAVSVDPGFQVEGIATTAMNLGPEGYEVDEAMQFFADLGDRVEGMPGVVSVAIVDALPMTIMAGRRTSASIPGYEPREGEDMEFQFHSIGPGFMDVLGMNVLRGREFMDADAADAQLVVMVNQTFAEMFWPGEDPIGKLVNWNGQDDAQVVGLVADAMYRDLRDSGRPAFFIPLAQNPAASLTLVARTDADQTREVLGSIRSEVAAIDRALPIGSLQSMEEAIAFTLLPQRIAGWLLTLAGGVGLLLATVGLYGVMSFLVAQRTREVAVRMALGAEARDVVRMVVGRGLMLAVVGAVVGLGLAAGVTRFAQSLLFGVSPLDVGVFALMATAAVLIGGLATFVPARRAARLDPMVALRGE